MTWDSHGAEKRLAELRDEIYRQMEYVDYPKRDWLPANSDVLDVLIVGGGQAGLAISFALIHKDVTNIRVVEAAPEGAVGPWNTFARMHTLRTPKRLKWADQGIPALTPRAWFEAKFGKETWDDITFIPRLNWNEYLVWYRELLDLPVTHETTVTAIAKPETEDGPFSVTLDGPEGISQVLANRIIFATGLEGAGGRNVPQSLFGTVPQKFWAHTDDPVDFESLRGKKVGVLGGGASAFDNAGAALEAGAAEVKSYMRRPKMPVANPLRWMEFSGFLEHYPDWDDDHKWAFTKRVLDVDQPATQTSLWRCYDHDNFSLTFSSPWNAIRVEGDQVVVDIAGQEETFDYLIAATGVAVDLGMRPELAEFVDDIQLWKDAYQPPAELAAPSLGVYPYLGLDFSFTAKPEHDAPWLSRLYHFAQGARITMGVTGHQLSGLPAGVDRIVWGITRDLFIENDDLVLQDFFAYETPELTNIGKQPEGTPIRQKAPSI